MFKVLNGLLGLLAIIICLGTVGIIVYSTFRPSMGESGAPEAGALTAEGDTAVSGNDLVASNGAGLGMAAVDEAANEAANGTGTTAVDASHVHNYVETVEREPDCLKSGRKIFRCECGAFYYKEILPTGHVEGEWEIKTAATDTQTGLRVRECIYCGIILSSEVIPVDTSGTAGGNAGTTPHVHEYVATIESSPSCTVAGIRRYVCSCGSYYRQNIPAIGHVVADWTVATSPSTTGTGVRQRICGVCHAIIDSQVIPAAAATATPSGSVTPGSQTTNSPGPTVSVTPGGSPTPAATPSPTPTATPHTHNFHYYVYRQPTCITMGIETGNCSCGADDSRPIAVDPTRHNYIASVVKPTTAAAGYTKHVCSICGDTYTDNEVPALQ